MDKRSYPSPTTPINSSGKKHKFFSSPNRFSVLSQDEDMEIPITVEQNSTDHIVNAPPTIAVEKHDKPPPIYVKGTLNFCDFRNKVSDIIGPNSYICKATTTHLKIQVDSPDNYRKLIHQIKKKRRVSYFPTPI